MSRLISVPDSAGEYLQCKEEETEGLLLVLIRARNFSILGDTLPGMLSSCSEERNLFEIFRKIGVENFFIF